MKMCHLMFVIKNKQMNELEQVIVMIVFLYPTFTFDIHVHFILYLKRVNASYCISVWSRMLLTGRYLLLLFFCSPVFSERVT